MVWCSGRALVSINEVNLRRARLAGSSIHHSSFVAINAPCRNLGEAFSQSWGNIDQVNLQHTILSVIASVIRIIMTLNTIPVCCICEQIDGRHEVSCFICFMMQRNAFTCCC